MIRLGVYWSRRSYRRRSYNSQQWHAAWSDQDAILFPAPGNDSSPSNYCGSPNPAVAVPGPPRKILPPFGGGAAGSWNLFGRRDAGPPLL